MSSTAVSSSSISPLYKLHRADTDAQTTSPPPAKKINTGEDLNFFLTTIAYRDLKIWITQLTRASFPQIRPDKTVIAHQLDDNTPHSKAVLAVQHILQAATTLIDQAPPDTGPRRFGNVAFRAWSSLFEAQAGELISEHIAPLLPSTTESILAELKAYLVNSFGSPQRLDYGTGHELSFIAFLGALWKLNFFEDGEEWSIVSGTIQPYILLVRALIKTYTLEPAGSHGVWGLDDHSFLPYILGSAQLGVPIQSSSITPLPTEGSLDSAPDPASIMSSATVNEQRPKNFYFAAIGFILDVKKGPFFEHSPYLYNISGIKDGWSKINKGMLKMYDAEVLGKFPVVQHFLFGSLWPWQQDPQAVAAHQTIHSRNQPIRQPMPSAGVGTAAPWAKTGTTNIGTTFQRPGR